MQAVILAGGKGTRLKPYTATLPKPLVPVGDYPILEIIIRQLKKAGFKDIVISTGYLTGLIKTYFGQGKQWGVRLSYTHENHPLNTAGALKLVNGLERNFIVMNGDILTTLNYYDLFRRHLERRAIATIALTKRKIKVDYGVVRYSSDLLLDKYIEKPEYNYFVSTGINVLNISCLDYIKKGETISMPELLLRMKKNKQKIYCYASNAYWLDIGRPDDYEVAQEKFNKNRKLFLYDEK